MKYYAASIQNCEKDITEITANIFFVDISEALYINRSALQNVLIDILVCNSFTGTGLFSTTEKKLHVYLTGTGEDPRGEGS